MYRYLIYFCIFFTGTLRAETIILSNEHSGIDKLIGKVSVLVDRSNNLNIDDIRNLPADRFSKSSRSSYGISPSTVWYRFEVTDDSSRNWFLVEKFGVLDYFSVSRINHDTGTLETFDNAGMFSGISRKISSRYIVQRIKHEKSVKYTYFIQVRSETPLLTLLYLMDDEELIRVSQNENMMIYAWLGIVSGLFIYNLILYAFIREKAYLWYCLYVSMFGWAGVYLTGLHYQYFGVGWTSNELGLNLEKPGNFLNMFIALSVVGMVNFCRHFIDVKSLLPLVDKVLKASMVLVVILAIPKIITRDNILSPWIFPIQSILLWTLFIIGVYSTIKRANAALIYYTIGWSMVAIGTTITSAIMSGAIKNPSFFQIYAIQFLSAFEMILLSIAVGYKVVSTYREKITQEYNQRKILEEKNQTLSLIQEEVDRENFANTQKLQQVSNDLNSMSSSLRAPMQLFSSGSFGGIANESIQSCVRAIDNITRYAEDLAFYCTLQSGVFKLNYTNTDLYRLCRSIFESFRNEAKSKAIDLKMYGVPEADTETLFVNCDEIRVRQILGNLVSNAITYTKENGTVSLYLNVTGNVGEEYCEIAFKVIDNGIGIKDLSSNEYGQLFNGSYKSNDEYAIANKGRGLGLQTSARLAKLHNGEIIFQKNSHSSGSCFEFRFIPSVKKVEQNKILFDDKNFFAARILFVGDTSSEHSYIHKCIAYFGEDIEIVTSYSEAIDRIKLCTYRYVIIDQFISIEDIRRVISCTQDGHLNKVIVVRHHSYQIPSGLDNSESVVFISASSNINSLTNALTTKKLQQVPKENNIVHLHRTQALGLEE